MFVPEFGTFNLKGEWIIENEGVHPDIEVDNLPGDELLGKDAQLERGIAEVLKRLEGWKTRLPAPGSAVARPAEPEGPLGTAEVRLRRNIRCLQSDRAIEKAVVFLRRRKAPA